MCVLVSSAYGQTYESELTLGISAYKNAHYEAALEHFRKATALDPSQTTAHVYLATICTSQYIPGVDSPDNIAVAEEAINHYQAVVDSFAAQNARINSLKGIAYLYLNMKKFEEAKHYYEKASGLDANDPDPYYSVGVIDWTACYQPRMEARAKLGMRPEEQMDPRNPVQKKVCDELRVENLPLIQEGIDSLTRAIDLRPDYDDAMAYMNLIFRERADLECDDLAARRQDLKTADRWVDRTLAVKKTKAERSRNRTTTAPNPQ